MSTDRDTLDRRSRLRAQSTGKRITPTERDLLWFGKLAEHGPLPTSFLLALSRGTHESEKRARERLTDLFHEENTPDDGAYLVRPPQQFRTIDARYNQLAYDLAPAGYRALKHLGGSDQARAKPSGPWWHGLMVSCITASVELATLDRGDIVYIPQSTILRRAQTALRYPVSIADPRTGNATTKDLCPDAILGLEYRTLSGPRFRFFAVEADRGTEPTTSRNWNCKSFQRSLSQYEVYVANGAYREHLKLSAPLLVMNVCCDEARMQNMLAYIKRTYPAGNAFMLFQAWSKFGCIVKPPGPREALLIANWERAGRVPLAIFLPG